MNYSTYNPNTKEEINQLFIKTFTDSESKSEGLIIGELTNNYMEHTDPTDFYCFVATDDNNIVASVFFSKLTFKGNIKAYILSPMAVAQAYQGKGIGQKLINFGLNTLKANNVALVVTYGDPNYYSKVGFNAITENSIKAPLKLSYPHGWLAQSFVSDNIKPIDDRPQCVAALNNQDLW